MWIEFRIRVENSLERLECLGSIGREGVKGGNRRKKSEITGWRVG